MKSKKPIRFITNDGQSFPCRCIKETIKSYRILVSFTPRKKEIRVRKKNSHKLVYNTGEV